MTNLNQPEILAPSGSAQSVAAAVLCGADAVYLGGERFSARANARNFTDEEMTEAVKYCHLHGVKVYRALNTVVFDNEIHEMVKAAVFSAEIGIDALIVEDMGAADIIKSAVPDIPLHASTQMTVYSVRGALEAQKRGFSRVVLARELPLETIKDISSLGIETEVFVHGALCMCLSGQCYMSAMIGSRSANRGRCAQCCRLPFTVKNTGDEEHALSLKDMSYAEHLGELASAGVSSFKIEGRMKRAEYVSAAVCACKAALSGEKPDMKTLKAVFSRDGFTDGYLFGRINAEMFGFRGKDDVTAAKDVLPKLRDSFRSERAVYSADFHFKAKETEKLSLEASSEGFTVRAEGKIPEKAKNRGTSEDYIEGQLKKLGNTVFSFGKFSSDIDEGLFVSASEINSLRRECVSLLQQKITERNTPLYTVNENFGTDLGESYKKYESYRTRIHVRNINQLEESLKCADYAVVPADLCFDIKSDFDKNRIFVLPPVFTFDEKKVFEKLSKLRETGFIKLYCQNISHIGMGRELNCEMTGGYRLNCTNSYSVKAYSEMGLSEITASFEARLHDISALCDIIPVSMLVYGYLPLMLTVNCPVRASVGCKNCTGGITDRTGRFFPVVCDNKNREYSEILNSDILYMADKLSDFHSAFCYDFLLYGESGSEISEIIDRFKNHAPMDSGFTRGLYFRGVI